MLKKTKIKIVIIILVMFVVIYLGLKLWVNYNINVQQIPVLAYHNIVPDQSYVTNDYTITVDDFERQMKYLFDHRYKTLTLDEFYNWKKNKHPISQKAVLLTFDDGYTNIYYLARPILQKYNYHATVFIIGNATNETTNSFNPSEYATIGLDIINTNDTILEYQSHTYNLHINIDNKPAVLSVSKQEMLDDFIKMKQLHDFEYLAYPYYTENKTIRDVLKEHKYKLAFRGEKEKTVQNANDYQIPRIEINSDFEYFQEIFETTKYNNRYANGIGRKILINIERRLKIRLF